MADATKDMAAVWWQEWEELVTFHDPLAAVSLFSDSVVSYARGIVDRLVEWMREDLAELIGRHGHLAGDVDTH